MVKENMGNKIKVSWTRGGIRHSKLYPNTEIGSERARDHARRMRAKGADMVSTERVNQQQETDEQE